MEVRRVHVILSGTGLILFLVGGCCVDSEGVGLAIAAVMVLAGLALMYAGWRYECGKKAKRHFSVKHRNCNPGRGYLDINYPGNYISKLK